MNRRTYLRGLTAAAGVSLAGCLGDDSASTTGLDWMPTPDVFGEEGYRVLVTPPAAVGEISDSLDSQTMANYRSQILDWQVADPEPSDVQRYVRGTANIRQAENDAGYIAVEHELETDVLSSNLRDSGFREAGTYEGFEMYETDDGSSARALQDGIFVAAAGPVGATGIVEGAIDTYDGTADRYEEANDAIADVVDAIDTSGNFRIEGYRENTNTIPRKGVFRGSVARGYSITLDKETVDGTRVERFVGDSDINEADIDTFTDSSPVFENAQGLDWEVDGSTLRIEWTIDTADLTIRQMG